MLTIFQPSFPLGDTAALYEGQIPSGTQPSILEKELKKLRDQGYSKVWRIPDISEFNITLNSFNPLLLAFGILGRYRAKLETKAGPNRSANRYLKYMFVRLHSLKPSPRYYWLQAERLVKFSTAYTAYCIHQNDRNLYRTTTISELRRILKTVHKLSCNLDYNMEFRRTYIPKGVDSYRPLGVPSKAWRIYTGKILHILENFIPINPRQHAFMAGRGTLTAWKQILGEAINKKFIFEFDLKQHFPSISLPKLHEILVNRHRFPVDVSYFLSAINYSTPTFEGLMLLSEQQLLTLQALQEYSDLVQLEPEFQEEYYDRLKDEGVDTGRFPSAPMKLYNMETIGPKWCNVDAYITYSYNTMNFWDKTRFIPPTTVTELYTDVLFPMLDAAGLRLTGLPPAILQNFFMSIKHRPKFALFFAKSVIDFIENYEDTEGLDSTAEFLKLIGTAQGSPLSPILANLLLNEIVDRLPQGTSITLYADDGILYGGYELKHYVESGSFRDDLSELGVTLHPEKSGWVRYQ